MNASDSVENKHYTFQLTVPKSSSSFSQSLQNVKTLKYITFHSVQHIIKTVAIKGVLCTNRVRGKRRSSKLKIMGK